MPKVTENAVQNEIDLGEVTSVAVPVREVEKPILKRPRPKRKPVPPAAIPDRDIAHIVELQLTTTEIEDALNSLPDGVGDYHYLRGLHCGDNSPWSVTRADVVYIPGSDSKPARNGKTIWAALVNKCASERRVKVPSTAAKEIKDE